MTFVQKTRVFYVDEIDTWFENPSLNEIEINSQIHETSQYEVKNAFFCFFAFEAKL